MLNLLGTGRRIGPDAHDAQGNPYELKTTTTTGLGTGRDIGFKYLTEMRRRYWVAARGRRTPYGFSFEEIYFLHPDDLSEWITPLENRMRADEALIGEAATALTAAGHSDAEAARLKYVGSRGLTLNNPKISWAYVQHHGTLLGEHPELDLAAIVAARALPAVPTADEGEGSPIREGRPPFAAPSDTG